jgi:NAD(P)-dependent dehydrogenase (short-subunit alcohol dehydrogenase family)
MKLQNATVLVTGANRGIGLAFAQAILARGARKVYAAARDPAGITVPGLTPLALDVTRPEQVAAAAQTCGDVTVLINNAGIAQFGGFLADNGLESLQAQLDVNLFGSMRMIRAFAPVLATHGGGAVVNVLSVASWINRPVLGAYGASKSAAWAMTNGVRIELAAQKTQVLAMHMGFVDTDLTTAIDAPKSRPEDVVRIALDALEAGASEVLVDEFTRQVHSGLSADPAVYLRNDEMRSTA